MGDYFFGGTCNGCAWPFGPPGTDGVAVMGAVPFAGGLDPGTDCFAGVFFSKIVELVPELRVATIESDSEVHMNTMAEIVVAFESSVADPRGPNAVCDPMPPNAPARSAAFPLCNRTSMIRKIQTTTWMMVNKMNMIETPV